MAEISPYNIPAGTQDDDSEWEYEYHETETEDFYVVLDLSSASNQTRPKKKAAPAKSRSKPKPATVPSHTEDSLPANLDPTLETPVTAQTIQPTTDAANDGRPAEPASKPEDRIQILEPHSSNPLVQYRNQVYSCEWTSTLGTDILLTAPEDGFSRPILREFPSASVLATTRIKLFGRPVALQPRPEAETITEKPREQSSAPEASIVVSSATILNKDQVKSSGAPLNRAANMARQRQATFLERFKAIKAAKNETDEVVVGSERRSGRRPDGPAEGSESVAVNTRMPGSISTVATAASRGGRAKIRKSTTKRVSFNEDIAGSVRTPASWDQLEQSRDSGTPNAPAVGSETATKLNLQQDAGDGPILLPATTFQTQETAPISGHLEVGPAAGVTTQLQSIALGSELPEHSAMARSERNERDTLLNESSIETLGDSGTATHADAEMKDV